MIRINNLHEMDTFAAKFVSTLVTGDLILLNGDLGAGKTTLAQFIGKHLGVKRHINSPTFNIIKSYQGSKLKMHHMDCYRLEGMEEDLGFDEYFDDDGISIVEWSQFIQDLLPEEHLTIDIHIINEQERELSLNAQGKHYEAIKEAIENEYFID